MSCRRLWVLIRHLPRDSAFVRAELGWHRTSDDILADIADYLRGANWQRGGDPKQPRPEPYPRPGDEQRTQASLQSLADELLALENEGGA